jgi:hypothetical protein
VNYTLSCSNIQYIILNSRMKQQLQSLKVEFETFREEMQQDKESRDARIVTLEQLLEQATKEGVALKGKSAVRDVEFNKRDAVQPHSKQLAGKSPRGTQTPASTAAESATSTFATSGNPVFTSSSGRLMSVQEIVESFSQTEEYKNLFKRKTDLDAEHGDDDDDKDDGYKHADDEEDDGKRGDEGNNDDDDDDEEESEEDDEEEEDDDQEYRPSDDDKDRKEDHIVRVDSGDTSEALSRSGVTPTP